MLRQTQRVIWFGDADWRLSECDGPDPCSEGAKILLHVAGDRSLRVPLSRSLKLCLQLRPAPLFNFIALIGLFAGTASLGDLVVGCTVMVQETGLGIENLAEEAQLARP